MTILITIVYITRIVHVVWHRNVTYKWCIHIIWMLNTCNILLSCFIFDFLLQFFKIFLCQIFCFTMVYESLAWMKLCECLNFSPNDTVCIASFILFSSFSQESTCIYYSTTQSSWFFVYSFVMASFIIFFLMIMSFKVLNKYIFLYVSNKDNFACPVWLCTFHNNIELTNVYTESPLSLVIV